MIFFLPPSLLRSGSSPCAFWVFPTEPLSAHTDERLFSSILIRAVERSLPVFVSSETVITSSYRLKAKAVSKRPQLSRRVPDAFGWPRDGSKPEQCPEHSREPLPPWGRSLQVFSEGWALLIPNLFKLAFEINGSFGGKKKVWEAKVCF